MRIRSIKPEFWRDETVAAIGAEIVYAGPTLTTGAETQAVAPPVPGTNYVYLFFEGDRLLYVGKSWNPWRRIERHRREKKWWPRVDHFMFLSVAGPTGWESDQRTDHLERLCIQLLDPSENKSRPSLRRLEF